MLNQAQLQTLATAMSEKDGTGSTRRIDAGYTYFGQFISHEIVRRHAASGGPAADPDCDSAARPGQRVWHAGADGDLAAGRLLSDACPSGAAR